MAEDKFVTRKDLGEVTQKVAIENSKDFAKPLIDQQKNNDLKELERTIEQKALFQDIADGIRGLGDSLLKGLKGLIPKTDGGLSKLLGLGLGLLLAPFVVFIEFIAQLGRELNFLTKGRAAEWLANFKLKFKTFFSDIFKRIKNSKLGKFIGSIVTKVKLFFSGIFNKLKNSKLGKFISGILSKLKNSKIFKSIITLFRRVFGGGGRGFFSKLSSIFKSIVKFAKSGPFKAIMKVAKSIGRIMGKVFLPITILMGIFDFVKGFMRGYKEGGIVEGIKQGVMDLVDGLIGNLIRMLMWIPTKLAEWLGLDNLAAAIGEYTDDVFAGISEIFSNLVDFVKALFTWDTEAMSKTLGGIWEGIKKVVLAPFKLIQGLVKDIFGGSAIERAKLALKSISLSMQSFFMYLQQGILQLLDNPVINNVLEGLDYIGVTDSAAGSLQDMKKDAAVAKEFVDTQKKAVERQREFIKEMENAERIREADRLKEKSQTNINTSNNSNSAVVNNVTYNVNAPNNLAANAIRNALGA